VNPDHFRRPVRTPRGHAAFVPATSPPALEFDLPPALVDAPFANAHINAAASSSCSAPPARPRSALSELEAAGLIVEETGRQRVGNTRARRTARDQSPGRRRTPKGGARCRN
jgi:hypothetical protein